MVLRFRIRPPNEAGYVMLTLLLIMALMAIFARGIILPRSLLTSSATAKKR